MASIPDDVVEHLLHTSGATSPPSDCPHIRAAHLLSHKWLQYSGETVGIFVPNVPTWLHVAAFTHVPQPGESYPASHVIYWTDDVQPVLAVGRSKKLKRNVVMICDPVLGLSWVCPNYRTSAISRLGYDNPAYDSGLMRGVRKLCIGMITSGEKSIPGKPSETTRKLIEAGQVERFHYLGPDALATWSAVSKCDERAQSFVNSLATGQGWTAPY